jgi:hypothetical protein
VYYYCFAQFAGGVKIVRLDNILWQAIEIAKKWRATWIISSNGDFSLDLTTGKFWF